jgi:lysophospholipase L1-like esterase
MGIELFSLVGAMALQPALIAVDGDSRPAQYRDSTTKQIVRNLGWQYWATLAGNGRYEFPPELNFAVAGQSTADIAARIDTTIAGMKAAGSTVLALLCGTNNPGLGVSLATAKGNFTTFAQRCRDEGFMLLIIAELPCGDSSFPAARKSAADLAYQNDLRFWLRTVLARTYNRNVIVHDPYPYYVQGASTTGDSKVGYNYDGLHPSPLGARILGENVASVLNVIFPPLNLLPTSQADLFDAATNPFGCLNTNPMFVGDTSGTADAISKLTVPTGVTATYTKGTDADGFPTQIVTLSGTPTTANPAVEFYNSGVVAGLLASDEFKAIGHGAVAPGASGILGFSLGTRATYTVAGTKANEAGDPGTLTSLPAQLLTDGWGGVHITPRLGTGLNEVPTTLRVRWIMKLIQNVAVSAVFTFKRTELRRYAGYQAPV